MNKGRYSNYKIAWDREKLDSFECEKIVAPRYVRIKPTNRCCHDCEFCVYKTDFSGMHETFNKKDEIFPFDLMGILRSLDRMGIKAITFSGGGEPLIHPSIDDALNFTREAGIRYSVITNGQALTPKIGAILSKASWVRISADYHNEEGFRSSGRGNQFDKTIENIINFAALRNKSCELSMNFIVTHNNCHTLYDAAKFWRDVGVDTIRFSPVWIKNFDLYHKGVRPAAEAQIDIAKSQLDGNGFTIQSGYQTQSLAEERDYVRCYWQEVVPVIGADMNVYRCHNTAYSADGLLGSIKDRDFGDMWFGEETEKRIREFNALNCVHQCANDKKNKFVHELFSCRGDYFQ
jgi:MoaA/NifB/PqqE/SkfB family radical SAM enzyme